MDDIKKLTSTILILLLTFTASGHALDIELEYVSPEQRVKLADLFTHAKTIESKDLSSLNDSEWSCEMYGMKSNMQVQRNIHLYNWNSLPKKAWQNTGASPISHYSVQAGVLTGKSDRLEDQVKFTADRRLISQLSVTTPQKVVIAYSVCKSI